MMGDEAGDANEAPKSVTVKPFRIMRTEVTNQSFAEFVKATSHVTDQEREGWGWVWPSLSLGQQPAPAIGPISD